MTGTGTGNELRLVEAAVRRTTTGQLSVTVANMELGTATQLSDAIGTLCHYAIQADVPLVVTVAAGGAGKKYMVIDENGFVTPASAPAPTRSDYVPIQVDLPRSLGSSDTDAYTTADWVERHVLDPTADQHAGPPPRRSWFRRR